MLSTHTDIDSFLNDSCASAYWKDKNGSYRGMNAVFVRVSNAKSPVDVLGKTDRDLLWAEQAPILIKNDQEVIHTGCTKMVLEPVKSFTGDIHYYLSHKTPVRARSGKIMGVLGQSFLIDNGNSIATAIDEVNKFGFSIPESTQKKLAGIESSHKASCLTKRQMECLFYLVKGMTIKQIANTLHLSPKTVEHYLDAVKTKLNCDTRSQLIEKALQLNVIREKL